MLESLRFRKLLRRSTRMSALLRQRLDRLVVVVSGVLVQQMRPLGAAGASEVAHLQS